MHDATPQQPFDVQSWYDDNAARYQDHPDHPARLLLKALGKDTGNWAARAFYSKKHPRAKRPNGQANANSFYTGDRSRWQHHLDRLNAEGKRIYFVVNEGGTKWSDITSCVAHFFEYDDLSISDYLARDWSTFKGGFFKPTADVFSGSRSPHGYLALKTPYTNPYRWVINQVRLNAFLESDPSICDPSRVFRLPGFDHTDDNGDPVRKSLLLRCEPELRYSIEEIEARLQQHEREHNIEIFDLLNAKSLCNDPEHREGTISGLVDIWGPEIVEEFEEHFKPRSKGTEHYVDGRSLEEIKNAFALIPAYEPGNGTYQGENPVTASNGNSVHIRYFSLLAGLKACFLQIRKTEQECIDFVCRSWDHLDSSYIASQISQARNGSVQSRTFWWFAEKCGYQLKKVKGTKTVTDADGEVKVVHSYSHTPEEKAEQIEKLLKQLYVVMGNYEDTFALREAYQANLYDLGVRRELIAERMLEMLEIEFGEKELNKVVERRAISASEVSVPVQDLIPGLVILNRIAVLVGNYGTWKTTIAMLIGVAVIEGGQIPLMAGPVAKKGRVLFIASDGDNGAIGTIKSYARRCGKPLEQYGDKFLFYGGTNDGQTPWSFCFRDLRKLNEDLVKYKETDAPIRLIIIDSVHAVMDLAGLDSGIGPMNHAMRLLGRLAARHEVSILLLHHTTKSDERVAGGHAGITQIADSVHFLTKEKRKIGDHPIRKLRVDKHRNGQERDFYFTVEDDEGVVIAPSQTDVNVQDLILLEMFREYQDGSGPRNLSQYLADYELSQSRVSEELGKMRRPNGGKLTRYAKGRWWLTRDGLRRGRALAKYEEDLLKLQDKEPDHTAEDLPLYGIKKREEIAEYKEWAHDPTVEEFEQEQAQEAERIKDELAVEAKRLEAQVNAELKKEYDSWGEVADGQSSEAA